MQHNPLPEVLSLLKRDKVLDKLGGFIVTKEEAALLADPEFIIDGLTVSGHLIVIAAAPNAGKTTIFFHLSGEMVSEGYKVVYVNADTSAGDAKEYVFKADEWGITLLLPDMKIGSSMDDVVVSIKEMNNEIEDLSGYVFVFDTLKKMVDVIHKSAAKGLFRLLRSMTAKGATIILLAHTNKYDDSDGKPIFEGTGDIKSDADELLYLIPEKHSDGSMTVSVEPDKTRAPIRQMSFSISPEREVILLDEYEDVTEKRMIRKQMGKDQEAIERITEAIEAKQIKQCDILEHCKNRGVSKRKVEGCLKRYSKGEVKLWEVQKGYQKNTSFYSLIKG